MDQVNEGRLPFQDEPPPLDGDGLGTVDDIPEAQRDLPGGASASGNRLGLWMASGIGAIALLGGMVVALISSGPSPSVSIQPLVAMAPPLTALLRAYARPGAADPGDQHPTLLGHRAFADAPADDLVAITADGQIRLRTAAAASFQRLLAAARQEGIALVPLSGFRSQADQNYLFFGIQEQRGQGPQARAEVSAPPGYSEHHTGYAVDIGDATRADTHVEPEFADTEAFAWLQVNAPRFGFELSFPPDNPQGVAYEPWHWRFVGDRDSLETFYQE